jgi:26S proteasome regulatory subunit N9
MDFVETQAQATPEVAEDLAALGELFSKKLYHELTTALRTFVQSDAARQRGQLLLDLEEKFLSKVESKLNQLQYAMILGDLVVGAVDSTVITAQEGIERLKKAVEDKRGRLGAEPSLYLEMEAALLALRGADAAALESVKKALEEAKPTMDGLTGTTDTAVFRKYYAAASDYRKLVGPPEAFYRAALSLLSYASADDMPLNKRRILATDVALAALSGEGVYNFGEVLATPILDALNHTPNAWLGDLLRIFAAGDVDAFNDCLGKNKNEYLKQPALRAKAPFVKEKIALLAFMNLVFETPAHERAISFQAIASRARLDLDHVEWLAMRAMALGLVKGVIDEVAQVVEVSWVQPRVLDAGQISHLIEQIDTLSSKSLKAHGLIAEQTAELL